jgi:hypothetical protein
LFKEVEALEEVVEMEAQPQAMQEGVQEEILPLDYFMSHLLKLIQ